MGNNEIFILRSSITHHNESYGNEKYINTTKCFFRKPVLSTSKNSLAFNARQRIRHAKLCLKVTTMDVYVSKAINNTLQLVTDYGNNNKYRQNPKIHQKSARRKCRSHLNHKFFSENFFYGPLNVFAKTMGAINVRIT